MESNSKTLEELRDYIKCKLKYANDEFYYAKDKNEKWIKENSPLPPQKTINSIIKNLSDLEEVYQDDQ